MPELPEVEVYKRRFDAAALRHRVDATQVRDRGVLRNASPAELDAAARHRRLAASARHGKYLFLGLDSGKWLAMHFGMTGLLRYLTEPDRPPEAHDRLLLALDNGWRLTYANRRRLGRVEIIDDPAEFIRAKHLGPDALRLTEAAFLERIADKRGSVKGLLMDQSVVAGLGNVYSDEALFQAGLHPQTPVAGLDRAARLRLFRAVHRVLEQALAAEADPARLPHGFLVSHRRRGAACPRCGGPVQSVRLGGRNSYFCPRCQPPP